MERVQDDLEVVLIEQTRRVTSHLRGNHTTRVGIECLNPNVESARVVQHSDDRALGRRVAFGWLLLDEVVDDGRRPPDLFVQDSVESRGLLDPLGLDAVPLARLQAGAGCPAAERKGATGLQRRGLRIGFILTTRLANRGLHRSLPPLRWPPILGGPGLGPPRTAQCVHDGEKQTDRSQVSTSAHATWPQAGGENLPHFLRG